MQEIFKLLISVAFLVLAFPIGDVLARKTKEELKSGKEWFQLIVYGSLLGGIAGMLIRNDVLMFGFFFMALVTNRSLRKA